LKSGRVVLEVLVEGDEPSVVLVPSARRGADDFALLAGSLHEAGFGSVAVNMRGVGRSSGPITSVTLREFTDDIAGIIEHFGAGPMHLVGHALGNVFVRATAAYHPEAAQTVSLLACGGHEPAHVAPDDDLLRHFERCSDTSLPDAARCESLQFVFFATGNDPSSWLDGWWPAADVRDIFTTANPDEWATAGTADVLIVQPLQDRLCPRHIGEDLARRIGPRAHYVEVDHCGHAILPEQPDVIADRLIEFLRRSPA
jgi:pimeloyl-ACP methyl ester carboxylesterase